MINFSILISLSEVKGPGGLFDINATLPLVAIQFILLMVILNVILYSPLLTVMEERQAYILSTLAEASKILEEGKKIRKLKLIDAQTLIDNGDLITDMSYRIGQELYYSEQKKIEMYLKQVAIMCTRILIAEQRQTVIKLADANALLYVNMMYERLTYTHLSLI
jgi:F-type H+-transporting ATPase subunit b